MSPTIYDVARHAGVGVGTVSRVLNDSPRVSEATRQKVLAVIEELDYHPSPIAQRLSLRKTFAIGVIAPFATQMYPKLYPFSISGYIDITSALCYTGNG